MHNIYIKLLHINFIKFYMMREARKNMKKKVIGILVCMSLIAVSIPALGNSVNSDLVFLNEPPVANAGGPYIGEEGFELMFDASDSYDPDGDELYYRWDFDGDGIWDTDWSEDPISYNVYGDNYEYFVFVEVTDDIDSDIDYTTALIENVIPEGDAGPDQTVNEGEEILFELNYEDPGWLDFYNGCCDFDIGARRKLGKNLPRFVGADNVWWDNHKGWNQLINLTTGDEDFNDFKLLVWEGTLEILNYPSDIWTITPSGDHYYGKTWNYSDGGVRVHNVVDVFKVSIEPGPQGFFRAEYQMTYNGKVINEGELKIDPPSDDFSRKISDSEIMLLHTVEFTYEDCGTYILNYHASDDDDGFCEDTCTITVLNSPPEIESFGPFKGKPGENIEISATATDPGSDDLTFIWDFGDETPAVTNLYYNNGESPDTEGDSYHGISPFTITDSVEHIYPDEGTYSLKLTVTDDNGGMDEHTTTVSVPRSKTVSKTLSNSVLMNFLEKCSLSLLRFAAGY
jgi:PKD repeat protein